MIPAFNEAGPHMGIGRIHNEDLLDMTEYMGKKGRDYGEGKRRNKKSKKRKSYKRKSMKRHNKKRSIRK